MFIVCERFIPFTNEMSPIKFNFLVLSSHSSTGPEIPVKNKVQGYWAFKTIELKILNMRTNFQITILDDFDYSYEENTP